MTQPQMPQPSPYQPAPATPRRRRKGMVWTGAVLMVLAPLLFCGGFFLALSPLMKTDSVPADGNEHSVSVPANEKRAVFIDPDSPAECTITDGSGKVRQQTPITGAEFTSNGYTATTRFNSGDGDLSVTCTAASPSAEARIGKVPSGGTFVALLVLSFVVPGLLFVVGLALLVIGLIGKKQPAATNPA